MRVVKGIIHQPYEVKGNSVFYAFSYYYDRAVESGLIGNKLLLLFIYITVTIVRILEEFPSLIYSFYVSVLDGTRGGTVEVRDFKKRAKEGKVPAFGSFPSLPGTVRSKPYRTHCTNINSQCLFAFETPDNRTTFTK